MWLVKRNFINLAKIALTLMPTSDSAEHNSSISDRVKINIARH